VAATTSTLDLLPPRPPVNPAGMPSNAIATGCVDFVLPLERIAAALVALTMAPGGAELLAVPTPSWAQLGA
jgi:two-component system chemotaxis response regulator CheB